MSKHLHLSKRLTVNMIGATLLVPLLLSGGCGTQLTVIEQEHQLTRKKGGNLADTEATTTKQRARVLADVLTERRDELAAQDIDKKELSFQPYGESTIILPNGQTHALVILYQTHKGARVMEGLQYGSFDLESGELRTVRAHLQKTAGLPDPPKPNLKTWSNMHKVFRAYLKQQGRAGVSFSISDRPVLSSRLKVGGYLVQYAYRNANGSLSRFAGIIEPDREQVHALYDVTTD